jgi:hypothetical protein
MSEMDLGSSWGSGVHGVRGVRSHLRQRAAGHLGQFQHHGRCDIVTS